MEDLTMTEPEQTETEETYAQPLPLSTWAIIGAILATIGFAGFKYGGFVVSAVALICAYAGRREINDGRKAGHSWASWGLWIGWLGVAAGVVVAAVNQ